MTNSMFRAAGANATAEEANVRRVIVLSDDPWEDEIFDFIGGAGGDRLDFTEFLASHYPKWDGEQNPFDDGLLKLVRDGKDTRLEYARFGPGHGQEYALVVFKNVPPSALDSYNFFGFSPKGGPAKSERFVGGEEADAVSGAGGSDRLSGGGGDDVLTGHAGADTVRGDSGDDRLDGGVGDDVVAGDDGDDTLNGDRGDDLLSGSAGDDVLSDPGGSDTLDGGDGDDRITIKRDMYASDTQYPVADYIKIYGGNGSDLVDYFNNNFRQEHNSWPYPPPELGRLEIDLGAGDDWLILRQASQETTIALGEGRDIIQLSRPGDVYITDFTPGPGGDVLDFEHFLPKDAAAGNPFGKTVFMWQSGTNTVIQILDAAGNWQATTWLRNVEMTTLTAENFGGYAPDGSAVTSIRFKGTVGDDPVVGSAINDILAGGEGDDLLIGRRGSDRIEGGEGDDRLVAGEGDDTVRGGAGDDWLSGGAGKDFVEGGDGADTLLDETFDKDVVRGEAGDDAIVVREGALTKNGARFTIEGGDGDDTVEFHGAKSGGLVDLGAGNDRLTVDKQGTTALNVVLGSGRDVVDVSAATQLWNSGIVIADFTAGPNGDVVDLRVWANERLNRNGYPDYNPFARGDLLVVQNGADAIVRPRDSQSVLLRFSNFDATKLSELNFGFPSSVGRPILGTDKDDQLIGTDRADTIDGLLGNDRISGGDGRDSLTGGDGNDGLAGGQGADTLNGGGGNDQLSGGTGDDVILGGAGDDYIDGNEGMDRIDAGSGDDVIRYSGGGDVIDGGAGRDELLFEYSYTNDIAIDIDFRMMPIDGSVRLQGKLVLNVEEFSAHALEGTRGDDRLLYGEAWRHKLYIEGNTGDDQLMGGSGVNRLNGGNGDDVLISFGGDDELKGGEHNDDLSAGAGEDRLEGETGNDRLDGGDDDDILDGFLGNDRLLGGAGDDRIIAYTGSDTVDGGAGDDTVSVTDLSKADSLVGGDGHDRLIIESYASPIDVDLRRLQDGIVVSDRRRMAIAGFEQIDFSLSYGDDRIVYSADYAATVSLDGLDGNDRLTGAGAQDRLVGGAGDDTLDGGSGADTLAGGAGDDTYYVQDVADQIIEEDGFDTVFSSVTFIVPLGVDRVVLTGTADLDVTGSDAGDEIIGNAGNNVFLGGYGNDRIDGGGGNDTAVFNGSGSYGGIWADLATGQVTNRSDPTDTLTSIENLIGSADADVLLGDAGANVLRGGLAGDTIRGGAGNDQLYGEDGDDYLLWDSGIDLFDGGAGFDLISLADATRGVTLDLRGSELTVAGETDRFFSIEAAIGSSHADRLVAGNSAAMLDGGAGDDVLMSGAGADHLRGGAGADAVSYEYAAGAVLVDLAGGVATAGGGVVRDTFVDIENVVGSAFNDIIEGAAGSNVIDGQAGDDIIAGGGGDDLLYGGAGYDVASYEHAASGVSVDLSMAGVQNTSGAGLDLLSGIESLLGSEYADRLTGDAGDNLLTGGGGNDVLTGGGGRDSFLLATIDVDTITDFTPGQDRILGVGAILGLTPGVLSPGLFRTGSVAQDADDRVLYDPKTGALYFDVDGVSGADALRVATLGANLAISASDFVVI